MNNCRIINAEIGLGYGVFSFIGCGIICLLSKDKNKSDLIYAEMFQWLLDTCVSFGLILGFAVIFIVKFTQFSWLIPYIDPVLVLIAGIVLIFMPIRLLLKNFKEIITMFASDEIQYDVYNIVKKMNVKFNINEEDLRISKMGQVIYIENIVSESLQVKTIDEADEYRNELIDKQKL
ncbi:cation transporter [Staphylococcus saccharolyticus]|uniref:cation transporter n=1 Tax=Staphylococcus saccharolyticus TaxID=33028 RepID=UPI0032DF9804